MQTVYFFSKNCPELDYNQLGEHMAGLQVDTPVRWPSLLSDLVGAAERASRGQPELANTQVGEHMAGLQNRHPHLLTFTAIASCCCCMLQ